MAALSRATGVPATTLKAAKTRHQASGAWAPTLDDKPQTIVLDVDHVEDLDRLLAERGLRRDDWLIVSVVVNKWEGFVRHDEAVARVPLRQLKVTLRPKPSLALLMPAVDVKPLVKPAKADKTSPRLVVFVGDEQEPHSDPALAELFLRWLERNQPDEGVHLGDLLDLGPISRHRTDPVWDRTVQDGINAGYQTLRHRREASPGTRWVMLPGNHEERIRDYQLAHAAALYGVRPADIDAQEFAPALSLRSLLHLDALAITSLGDNGDYEHVQHDVCDGLVARHGWITGANTAEKSLRKLGISVVVGHTHDQKITYERQYRGSTSVVLQAVETGTMCRVAGGLGYTVNPSWVNGFATAVVDPAGGFVLELATYQDGVLRWRDQRYSRPKTVAVAA